jgi:hypothetical protein
MAFDFFWWYAAHRNPDMFYSGPADHLVQLMSIPWLIALLIWIALEAQP